ncbi:MAG TPA: hypothetical protein VGG22_11115 [Candidatus Baltobacteraceae bacterium]
MHRVLRASLGLLLLATTSCGGVHGSVPASIYASTATIRVSVPASGSSTNARLRRAMDIASSTMGLSVDVYAHGDRATILASTTADISSSSPQCTANSGGGRSCTVSLTVPAGNDDFVFTTYDATPIAGSFAGAQQLGYGLDSVTVVYGSPATIGVTLSSVLASVALTVTPAALHLLIPATATLGVVALDANNNVIVSSGFVDAQGDPITLSFTASPSGFVTFSPSTLTAPATGGVHVVFSGNNGGAGNFPITLTASSSTGSVVNATANLAMQAPTFTSISDPNLSSLNPYHENILFDPSGGIYYPTSANLGGISYYSGLGSSVSSNYAATASEPIRGGIASVGPGALFAIAGNEELTFSAPPSSTIGPGPNSNAAPVPNGSAMVYDQIRGTLDYASGTVLALYPLNSGSPTTASLGTNTHAGIAIDTSGNLWIVDYADELLLEWNGSSVQQVYNSSAPLFDVVTTSSGIFLTVQGTNPAIVQLNSSGSVLQTIAMPSNVMPWYMCADRAQPGVVWFDYITNAQIGIGRVDASVTPATVSTVADVSGPNGSRAGAIGCNPNGLMYMLFDGTDSVVQVQP